MEEPTIKYESCEELYAENAIELPNAYEERAMKRSYAEAPMANYQVESQQMQGHYGGYYNDAHEQQQYQQPQTPMRQPDNPVKRCRRIEAPFVFGPPFFELQQDYENVASGGTITARCLTCNVVLRGHKNVSSNFLKHMKRLHPEIHKIYESLKLIKYRGHAGTTESSFNQAAAVAAAGTTQYAATNEFKHGYFDASNFLEQVTAAANAAATAQTGDEEHTRTSESTDQSTATPPNANTETDQASSNGSLLRTRLMEGTHVHEHEQNGNTTQVLSNQILGAMQKLLEEKLKSFVPQSEFNATKEIVTNLAGQKTDAIPVENVDEKTTQETHQTLKTQVTTLEQECQTLRTAVEQSQRSKRQIQNELHAMDKALHRKKLVIRNLKLEKQEQPMEAVEKLFRERLELPDVTLKQATVLYQSKQQQNKQHVLVELHDEKYAKAIFGRGFKLKNTGIFIEPSMSHYARKRRDKLLVLRKELLRRNAKLKVHVRDMKLNVNGKLFYWDDVDGLCADAPCDSAISDATEYLKTLTDIDLKEFLNVLKNYDIQIR